ncbi:DNA topoisomerase IV subunit B [Mycoplasmoides gallisepticum CA06_2006.052-5-2P]|uniref:DNA topoisomerase (ATP-hydrolyzing) n=1 Tax=Mycoplasmoides gallisepticum WI01_2001.043-13-2P TaxID=1159201 RepID=J3YT45_MYCGL|nr:DNA topoisomerase IV subunit B [Mycoplasmoides gallisepticum]AFP75999.1 DNA topoisomerase IV subunit B [Mycoplasmoides gallisepticum VA94_7994-1-7P]AFP76766.1 DNA topoisomerase IV subunit B [Mycoplasmoides gallisepticum NC95_13295-2-2P]AFP77520.1 DNA topoisomerase IV subunit B [Mycoplasmoides gallisepticum NC96_1596-4-2P]AFP78291.1 DNA topoisomerase IV subunit B [Mycoplasmoides gallisepticum NY01_2001.047-5-1P]AFP79051.1 DNA topoisomerase IV subunit B [Mycoplasmoides gallisepticum WI01_2001
MVSNYNEKHIKVLKGLEPVRKRPGMYIGSTDTRGLHHLVWELFDNAVDEALNGSANKIEVVHKKDGSIIVTDNGRGIPVGKNLATNLSTVDTVYTVLHAGGKFDDQAYKVSGGLHGVGASVVNALSRKLIVNVHRDGGMYESIYQDGGKIIQPLKKMGSSTKHGTIIQFWPDPTIFKNIQFNPYMIKERLHESSFLFKGLKIVFVDENNPELSQTFIAKDGILEYLKYVNENKKTISKIIPFKGDYEKIVVDGCFQYTDNESELIISFANSVKTSEGGSHENGFKQAMLETINDYSKKYKLINNKDKGFDWSDLKEGLSVVLSVQVPEKIIAYEGQTKNKLFTQEAKVAVAKILTQQLFYFLEENQADAKQLIERFKLIKEVKEAAKKAKENTKKLKSAKSERVLYGKLTPAQQKNPLQNEIFLVEGDSAGGTAKSGRDKRFQAILPLRGKVVNVEKSRLQDLLKNEEILSIISCLGCGIGNNFNIKNLKYHKIIIMTDADTDGAHIQVLLLTFFYRYMKELIEQGKVYIALAPLYKITAKNSNKSAFAWDDYQLDELRTKYGSYEVQRYKGLGEMNSEQLWTTTMDPSKRQLIQVSIQNAAQAERKVSILMGDDASIRKNWINENVDFSIEE